jgi:hypothetical protein
MDQAIPLRSDYTADQLRRLARQVKDAAQARRLLAIAAVLDGASRADAARNEPARSRPTAGRPPFGGHPASATCSIRMRELVRWALSAFEPVPSNKFSAAEPPRSSSFQHTERDGCPVHVVKAPCGGRNVLAHARTRAQEVPEFVITAAISSG